jgi:Flp pilus assembly pilin Flp
MSTFEGPRERAAEEQGQTFVEYALVLAAVVVGVLLTITWTGLQDVVQAAMDAVAGAV